MNFLSLFTGIGGIDLGLERAGLRCVGQVERDEYCRRVLTKRFPAVPKWAAIETFNPSEVNERVDLVAFGDPCQRNANCCRNGGGPSSPADQALRVVDAICPVLVLRENPSVVRRDAEWPWWRMRHELERRNYAVLPFRLRACCVGADHRRERLFLLAELSNAYGPGLEGDEREEVANAGEGGQHADASRPDRRDATPRICRGADGIPHRVDRLRSLGNAVYTDAAEWIGRRILEASSCKSI